jgi:hypothetical protein
VLNAAEIAAEKKKLARLLEAQARQWADLKFCPFVSEERRRARVLELRSRARTLKRSAQKSLAEGAHGPKFGIYI